MDMDNCNNDENLHTKNNDENLDTKNNDETTVLNVCVKNIRPKYKNLHKWMLDKESNVYIGRSRVVFIDGIRYPLYDSIWANPFKITETQSREQVLKLYREYIENKLESDPILVNNLLKLKGKKLGCWCKPNDCHGDILVELISKYENKK